MIITSLVNWFYLTAWQCDSPLKEVVHMLKQLVAIVKTSDWESVETSLTSSRCVQPLDMWQAIVTYKIWEACNWLEGKKSQCCEFTGLCWTTFTATRGHMWLVGCRLDMMFKSSSHLSSPFPGPSKMNKYLVACGTCDWTQSSNKLYREKLDNFT